MAVNVAPCGESPPGRLAGRWVPWLVIGLWVALAAVMVPLSGKLSSVTTDKAVDALPASAESTKVAVLEESLPGAEDNTFVFVYHRPGGLTYADRATAERHYDALAKRYPPTTATSGEEDDDGPPVRPSTNGKAVMFTLDLSTTYGPPEELVGPLRDAAKDRPAGLELEVTGPAAVDGDLDAVFDGIDLQVFLTTVIVVTILLILTYRSPVLWFIPLVVVGAAAMATVYLLVKGFGIVVDNQNSALLTILVFGVGTDYALLLIARYRETLHHHENVRVAMVHALRGAAPAIIASAATVVAGLLCLLAADLNSISGLGPIGAAGILCALVAMLTLFPAVLVLLGRRIFWPAIPRFDTAVQEKPGLWGRLGAPSTATTRTGAVRLRRRLRPGPAERGTDRHERADRGPGPQRPQVLRPPRTTRAQDRRPAPPARRQALLRRPATWPAPDVMLHTGDDAYGHVDVRAWHRLHPHQRTYRDPGGAMTIVEGTLIRLHVSRLPGRRDREPKTVWLWWHGDDVSTLDLDRVWRCYVRRFDIEHTFRFAKQAQGWTTPKLRTPDQADRWIWLIICALTQLCLARTLVSDHRLPWQPPLPAEVITPGRVRQGFGPLLPRIGTPASAPKPTRPGPGRPKGSRSTPAQRHPAIKKNQVKTPKNGKRR